MLSDACRYNAAVAELHQLTHADVSQLEAGATLTRLGHVAERAAALGAPEDLMHAAQVRANALHASHVELLHARARAEAEVLDTARATHAIGIAGADALRAALAHAASVQLEGEVLTTAQATLEALLRAEAERELEHAAATRALEEATAAAQAELMRAAETGETLREFGRCAALREALQRALAHNLAVPDERRVEHRGTEEARQTLISLELAERAHLDEVRLGLPLSALDCIAHSP